MTKRKKAASSKKAKPPQKAPIGTFPPPLKVETRYRREIYVGKRAEAQRASLVAHIGTSWEPLLGTFPANLSPEDDRHVREHVIAYYRKHPDHPYHPSRWDKIHKSMAKWYARKEGASDPDAEQQSNPVLEKLLQDIDRYNAEHAP